MSIVNVSEGDYVLATNAFGEQNLRMALSGVELEGHDFPVIWICTEEELKLAQAEGREPDGIPWPAEDITPV